MDASTPVAAAKPAFVRVGDTLLLSEGALWVLPDKSGHSFIRCHGRAPVLVKCHAADAARALGFERVIGGVWFEPSEVFTFYEQQKNQYLFRFSDGSVVSVNCGKQRLLDLPGVPLACVGRTLVAYEHLTRASYDNGDAVSLHFHNGITTIEGATEELFAKFAEQLTAAAFVRAGRVVFRPERVKLLTLADKDFGFISNGKVHYGDVTLVVHYDDDTCGYHVCSRAQFDAMARALTE